MRRKGIFTILTAAFMVLAFSAMALAANNVRLTTTVPNIPKSTCYQAGTDTLEHDTLTAMAEGDATQITLNNKVTVCKAIDMFITVAAPGLGALETSANAPVSTTGGSVNALGGTAQWGFLVQAASGSQLIRVTLRVRDSTTGLLDGISLARIMTFTGLTASDKLLLKLFDGKFGNLTSLIYTPVAGGAYTTLLTAVTGPTTNILCIDTLTQDFPDEYVQNTPDSQPINFVDKLFYSGDYRIAHIMTAQTFNLLTCKGATCGNIVLGASGQASTCVAFDYDTIGTGSNGYCTTHTANTGYLPKLIIQTSQAFDLVPYIVSAEILVNGVAGEHGVYWSSTAPAYARSSTTLCGVASGVTAFVGAVGYLRGDGVTAAVPVAPISATCAGVATAAKAVKFTTTSGALFVAGDMFFELNLPPFNYNLAEVNAGDVVTVRVTLTKGTCGVVTFDLCIGTFGCPAAPPGAGATQLCPYVTSLAAGDNYWDGIALVNTGATAGTVTLTAYKNDGTTATFTTPSIAANGMYVSLVGSIPWVGTTPSGVPAFIRAAGAAGGITGTNLSAFIMMADGKTDSMGYLCK